MASPPQRRRAARLRHPLEDAGANRRGPSSGRKQPITVDAIIDAAFGIVERDGYDSLTMRRVAVALDTGPASLYAHVVNKKDLDELLIGRLCSEISLPQPNSNTWQAQIVGVCAQIRDQYLRYPGISRAAYAMAATDVEILRISEGMLAILLDGGVAPQAAAWAIDALLLYVASYCVEIAVMAQREVDWQVDADELQRRLAALPAETFPCTTRYAAEVTAGEGHDRFDFTLALLIDGLEGHRAD